jgi:tetratricopeptide (TPR) repeat protein
MERKWSRLTVTVIAMTLIALIVGCGSSSYYVRSAKLHINNKNFEEAKRILEEGANTPPNDTDPNLYITKALVHFQLNEWEPMLEAADKALELDPSREKEVLDLKDKAWRRIASTAIKAFQEEKYEEAISTFKLALKVLPDNAETWTNLGLSYYKSGQYEQAAEVFEKAITLDESDAVLSTKINLLETYRLLERYEDVVSLATKIVEDTDSLGVDRKIALIQSKAIALQALNRTDEAIGEWDALIQEDPENANFAFNKALLLDILERYDEAAKAYLLAIELNPEDNEARMRASNALLGSQQWETIVKVLEPWLFPDGVKVYEPEFTDLHTWMTLKAAYANLGQTEDMKVVDEIIKKING